MMGAMKTDIEDTEEAARLALVAKYQRPGSWTTFFLVAVFVALPVGLIIDALTRA